LELKFNNYSKEDLERLIYGDGRQKRRSKEDTSKIKALVETNFKFKPRVFCTLTLLHDTPCETARAYLNNAFNWLSTRVLRCHVLPLLAWRHREGKVRNDVHAALLTDNVKGLVDNQEYANVITEYFQSRRGKFITIKDARYDIDNRKIMFPFGNIDIRAYEYGGNAIPYILNNHFQLQQAIYCPNRGSCKKRKSKNRSITNDCVYRKDMRRLIK